MPGLAGRSRAAAAVARLSGVHAGTEIICPDTNDGDADWPATGSGDFAEGTCAIGFTGEPYRLCKLDGSWDIIQNPCSRTSPHRLCCAG